MISRGSVGKGSMLFYVGLQNAGYFDVPPSAIYARTGVPVRDNIYRVGLNCRWPIAGK